MPFFDDSCRKVPEVAEMSSSAMGFLQFMADNSISEGTLFNLIYTPTPIKKYKPLIFEIPKCNNDSGTLFNYTNIKACSCTFCEDSCSLRNITVEFPSFFNGFSFSVCIIVYSILIFSTLLIYIPKKIFSSRNKSKKNEEQFKDQQEIRNNE